MSMGISGILLIVYVIGVIIEINCSTIHMEWDGENWRDFDRKLTTKDVHKALIWPITFTLMICLAIICFIHEVIGIVLLALGIQYTSSSMYYKIYTFLDKLR